MASNKKTSGLMLMALGVVFGDIGTSPLYAFRECFGVHSFLPLQPDAILGILSLIIWALILVISLKYLAFVMKAHNKGEGGEIALASLLQRKLLRQDKGPTRLSRGILLLGIIGASLLYADGIITPAISVLSAVEGISVVTPVFDKYIIPIALVILLMLFGIQSKGTATIGKFFGPIVLIWFSTIGILGLFKILDNPSVLAAFNPMFGIELFQNYGKQAFYTLGALFLVVTGAEACYADMGHFGVKPISRGWFFVVFPGLLLSYLGQAALLIENPGAISNPFYLLAPKSMLIPMVVLATITSAIASQAVISGAYSLTRQAIQLGILPRMTILHTSAEHEGQIYVPTVNKWLAIGTFILVITFQNSSNLAAAYGIAVSSTMLLTTLLMFVVCIRVWKWNKFLATLLCSALLIIDIAFMSANSLKFFQGGWFPVVVGLILCTIMTTWYKGRQILGSRLAEKSIPWEEFSEQIKGSDSNIDLKRVEGTSVFMTRSTKVTPVPLIHNVKHNQVLHETVLLLTIATQNVPFVEQEERLEIIDKGDGIYRVIASLGFQEEADIDEIISQCREKGLKIDKKITYFLGREILISTERPGMARWREKLFALTSRNAERAAQFFHVPSDEVFEVGIQIEL